ncbi:MAG: RHS repeat-associated core domain-containing protein [Thermoflexus hugenholtzii]|uniref:RHS repeat-associated core domain-containing protein n=1 Tax=Thermoflexus TaxID=1495649 RepID=UPI001C78C4E0|nr:MAG: RHS repeat-associated core domain-containing protein [Thermoflexus hugenholtzii]
MLAQGGSPAGVTRYLPYGAIRLETGRFPTDHRFTGQRWKASLGLYDYRARFYDPTLGRFLQPDSLVPKHRDQWVCSWHADAFTCLMRCCGAQIAQPGSGPSPIVAPGSRECDTSKPEAGFRSSAREPSGSQHPRRVSWPRESLPGSPTDGPRNGQRRMRVAGFDRPSEEG